jgi:hypothetical protein
MANKPKNKPMQKKKKNGKKVKTGKKMAQKIHHDVAKQMNSIVPVNYVPRPVKPMKINGKMRKSTSNATFSGTDFISTVTWGVGNVEGDNLISKLINPYMVTGSRLAKLAPLWEMYRFTHVSFQYVNSIGTTSNGQLIHAITRDVDDPVSSGRSNIQMLSSIPNRKEFAPYRPSTCGTKLKNDKWYYTDDNGSDDRLVDQGRYQLAVSVPNTALNSTTTGKLYFSYKIEFRYPTNDQAVPQTYLGVSGDLISSVTTAPFGTDVVVDPQSNLTLYSYNHDGVNSIFGITGLAIGTYFIFTIQMSGTNSSMSLTVTPTGATLQSGYTCGLSSITASVGAQYTNLGITTSDIFYIACHYTGTMSLTYNPTLYVFGLTSVPFLATSSLTKKTITSKLDKLQANYNELFQKLIKLEKQEEKEDLEHEKIVFYVSRKIKIDPNNSVKLDSNHSSGSTTPKF